jgi:excisionase family DNA binding protein
MDMQHEGHGPDGTVHPDADELLTVAEVAAMTRVSKMTIYRLVHGGELEALQIGRSFRIRASAANELLTRGTARQTDQDRRHA